MSDTEYELWADYYDIIHTGLPGEAEFYVGQAARIKGDTLELGCGTGRICIPMAMSGANVVGLDNSPAMLSYCREKQDAIGALPGHLRLLQADMRSFELGRLFDLAVMPYRTFMHLLGPEDQRRCLQRVYRHLAPGGTFIVSLWAAKPQQLVRYLSAGPRTLAFAGRYRLPQNGGYLVHFVSSWCDDSQQIIEEEHVIHEIDDRGEAVRTLVLPMRRSLITPDQMRCLLQTEGFYIEALFGDFDCNPFTQDSSEMIWIARK